MTTAEKNLKRTRKITSLLLPVIFLFTACSSNNVGDYPYLSLEAEGADEAATEFRIVINQQAPVETVSEATDLCREIEEKTGVVSYTVYDNEYVKSGDGIVEVVIGNTSRELSHKLLFGLRTNDYVCKDHEGSVLIGGKSDSATLTAIRRFRNEILPAASKFRLIPIGGGFEFTDTYAVKETKLNGIGLGEYKIVFAGSSSAARNVAEAFQASVSDRLGYWLDIEYDYEYVASGGVLYIATPSSSEKAPFISPDQSTLSFCSSSEEELYEITDHFISMLEGSDGELTLTKDLYPDLSGNSILLASLLPTEFLPLQAPSDVTKVTSVIEESLPYSVFFGDLPSADGIRITNGLLKHKKVVADDGIYTYAVSNVEFIFGVTDSDVLIEAYRINNGILDFILLRISGAPAENVIVDVSELKIPDGIPIITLVHIQPKEGVSVEVCGSGENVFYESVKYGKCEYCFACYADEEILSVSASDHNYSIGYHCVKVKKKY